MASERSPAAPGQDRVRSRFSSMPPTAGPSKSSASLPNISARRAAGRPTSGRRRCASRSSPKLPRHTGRRSPASHRQLHRRTRRGRLQATVRVRSGRRYQVVFEPAKLPGGEDDGQPEALTAVVGLPARDLVPSTVVTGVFPSGDAVPENQLRLYIHFSAPMGLKGGIGTCSTRPAARFAIRSCRSTRTSGIETGHASRCFSIRAGRSEAFCPRGDGPLAGRRPLLYVGRFTSGATPRACRSRRSSGAASKWVRPMNGR